MEKTGRLFEVKPIEQKTDKFKTRNFVLYIENQKNQKYSDYLEFQLTNDNCGLVDNYERGAYITVTFDITGRRWQSPDGQVKYFNTLSCWGIHPYSATQTPPAMPVTSQPTPAGVILPTDDLPF